jgi:hypothetical protein
MKINEDGLFLSKAELNALLAFAGRSPELMQLYGVQFRSDGARVTARATNGAIAAEAEGECEGMTGEWFVHRDFLQAARKLLDKDTYLRLSFEALSLRDAVIVDEEGNARSTLSWPEDAVLTQLSLPNVEKLMNDRPSKRQVFKRISLSAEYLGELKLISRAAGVERIDCYPPVHDEAPAIYACNGESTNWRALIAPMKTLESEQGAEAAE